MPFLDKFIFFVSHSLYSLEREKERERQENPAGNVLLCCLLLFLSFLLSLFPYVGFEWEWKEMTVEEKMREKVRENGGEFSD